MHIATQDGASIITVLMFKLLFSFIYALNIANTMILSKQYKTVLIVGAEKLSILDFEDRTTCVLFGDGAVPLY